MRPVNKQRPVNLQLTTIKFPITAITSILHRITGVLLFLSMPVLLWTLDVSLSSEAGFECVRDCFSRPFDKFLTWVLLSCVIYHVVAGVRHLLMDLGYGESKSGGRVGAKLIILVSLILIILVGLWIW